MRPAVSLCLLAVFALGASLCNRRLPARRQQAPSLPPSPVRRDLTPEEAVRLAGGRVVAEAVIGLGWPGLSPEECARLAMAWPAYTPLVSTRLQ